MNVPIFESMPESLAAVSARRDHQARFCERPDRECALCAGRDTPGGVEIPVTTRVRVKTGGIPVPHDVAEQAVRMLLEHVEVVVADAQETSRGTTWTFHIRRGEGWGK